MHPIVHLDPHNKPIAFKYSYSDYFAAVTIIKTQTGCTDEGSSNL